MHEMKGLFPDLLCQVIRIAEIGIFNQCAHDDGILSVFRYSEIQSLIGFMFYIVGYIRMSGKKACECKGLISYCEDRLFNGDGTPSFTYLLSPHGIV